MDNFERYNRNQVAGLIDMAGQKKLNSSRVLIAGLGGLGSVVVTNLACLGIENLGLLDYDKVDVTNLNRQFIHPETSIGKAKTQSAKEFINKFNSRIKTKEFNLKLTEENAGDVLQDYDYVMDCFDNWESKLMLNRACIKYSKTLVHAGVEQTHGQVMAVVPKKTCCLNCLFDDAKVVSEKMVISPIVNIIGSLAAFELVKIILNTANDEILRYDLMSNDIKKMRVEKNPDCKVCAK